MCKLYLSFSNGLFLNLSPPVSLPSSYSKIVLKQLQITVQHNTFSSGFADLLLPVLNWIILCTI